MWAADFFSRVVISCRSGKFSEDMSLRGWVLIYTQPNTYHPFHHLVLFFYILAQSIGHTIHHDLILRFRWAILSSVVNPVGSVFGGDALLLRCFSNYSSPNSEGCWTRALRLPLCPYGRPLLQLLRDLRYPYIVSSIAPEDSDVSILNYNIT